MNVLLVTESPAGGTGRHVTDLADGLARRGCRVHLVYSGVRIDRQFRDWLAVNPNLRSERIKMRQTPHFRDVSVIRRLQCYAAENGPFDIVHAHSSKAGAVVRMCRFSARPGVIYTPHGVFSMNPLTNAATRWLGAIVERCLAARCQAVIAVSPAERKHLVGLGIKPAKVEYIPNGLAPQRCLSRDDVRHRLQLPRHDRIIGFLGRLVREKDPEALLRAFALLAAADEQVKLAMVGTGPLEGACRALARELGCADRVYWLGYQTAENAMPAFDVFVMPSRTESMPYVLLEALAAGVPIVATRVGGVELVVESGVNGYLVEPGAPASFVAPIQAILHDPELRDRFAAASRRGANRFTVAAMVDKTLAVYTSSVP